MDKKSKVFCWTLKYENSIFFIPGTMRPVYTSPLPDLPPGYELVPISQLTPEHEVVPWSHLPDLLNKHKSKSKKGQYLILLPSVIYRPTNSAF